jgi:hypothetical protein
MVSQISLIFIIFILLVSTLLVFVIYRIKNSAEKVLESFTTPTAVNVPDDKPKPFYVGNKKPMRPDEPIVGTDGVFKFRKNELLYDGIYGDKCGLKNGFKLCVWNDENSYLPLDKEGLTYATDKFLQIPKKKMPNTMNGEMKEGIISPPDCPMSAPMNYTGITYDEYNRANPPIYLSGPTTEDVLGFYPQNNNNIVPYDFPLPQIGRIPEYGVKQSDTVLPEDAN